MKRHKRNDHRLTKGLIAGMLGGLAASWTMNQFQSAMQKVEESWKKSAHQPPPPEPPGQRDSDDATMKTADRLFHLVAHRHLTKAEKNTAGPIVHYAYGTIIGGVYGVMAELVPASTAGVGTGYASAAWLVGDEIAVWKLGFSGPPVDYPVTSHAKALASHLVYGATAEFVRKSVRAIIK